MITLYAPLPRSVPIIQCSPPSWACQMALEEKGSPHEVSLLDFARGEHKTAEMLAKNPRGTIPVLEHDGVMVHETFAILQYVDAFCPGAPLAPRDRAGAALALTRLHESAALKDRGMALFAHLMRSEDAARASSLARDFERELDRWNASLADHDPGVVELADLVVFAYAATAERLGLDLASRPALARLCDRMRGRRAVQATWPETWNGPRDSAYPG
jgi:glutathione S-transferase